MGTVVACSTPFGSSGIAIVRISGDESHKITSLLINNSSKKNKHNSPTLFSLVDVDGFVYDEAVVNFLFGPNTYTGEDLVEINLHGNPVIIEKTIALCCSYGATAAPGGEFTKRAFLNGKWTCLRRNLWRR